MSVSSIKRVGRAQPVSEIAAQWVLRQEEDALTPSEQRELEAWLAAHPAHAAAYENAIWALDTTARHAGEPELIAMREAALAARGERPRHGWVWGALGGAIAASFLSVWLWTNSPESLSPRPAANVSRSLDPGHVDYATAVGQRLAVTLPDSSVVTLDTNSRIRVAYSALERGVQLLKGQALFEVAHGKLLPFHVYAAGQRITAIGTLFNVRLDGARVKVALLQGVIRVRPAPPLGTETETALHELVMHAGETAELRPTETAVVRTADVSQIASWRGGDLVFNDIRLADAVAEINRYTNRPITIADNPIGEHRITGIFRSNDPEHFSEAMSQILPVEVAHSADGAPILKARN